MADPAKKFSFGFSKTTKKPNLSIKLRNEVKADKQLIDCLEGKLIKVKGEEKRVKDKPLIIPLQPSSRRVLVKSENGEVSLQNEQKDNLRENVTIKQEPGDAEELPHLSQTNDKISIQIKTEPLESEATTLEEIAAREILREAEELQKKEDYSNLTVSATQDSDILASEPTEEDYESIPVSAFGQAMLKGMGWQEEAGIGKKPQFVGTVEASGPKRFASSVEQAMRAAKTAPNLASKTEEEDLKLIKGAFVKVGSGSMKGEYGVVEGFTDECDRVVVKMFLRGGAVSCSEAALQVVTKSDYEKNSRVLNTSKYEEVKNKVSQSLDESSRQPSPKKKRRSPGSSTEGRHRSPVRRRSPSPRRKKERSPDQRRERSPDHRRERLSDRRRERSPDHRRERSPDQRRERSPDRRRERSPDRRRERSPDLRRERLPETRKPKREMRDRSASPDKRPKQSQKRSPSSSPDRSRRNTHGEKYSRKDSPRKITPPKRRNSLSPSVRDSKKKNYEESSKRSRDDYDKSRYCKDDSGRRSVSRSPSPGKSRKLAEKSRREPSSDSDSNKKVKKSSKKKHKQRSSSVSSSDSDSSTPMKSSVHKKKKKKSHKKKKSKRRDSSSASSPESRKNSSKK